MYYWDFETGINDITLYINGEKNITTKYENTTLKDLKAGKYEIYYTTCNQKSNTVTFKIIGDSQITTPEVSYEYYEGINNKIPLIITDPSGEKGTINITVKEDNEYKPISTYYNVADGYKISTNSIIETLENMYNTLDTSYTINITYSSQYTYPSSTEFTININNKKSTNIVYNIINNTEGNLQINITVQETITQTPIQDANIQITGDITSNTTSGIITDDTLTTGEHTITVQFSETENYKASETTINFNIEIDKDKKIAELEEQIENLTNQNNNLTNQLNQAENKINNLNNNITNLTEQLIQAQDEINTLTQDNNNLKNQLETANNTINNLTTQLTDAEKEIEELNEIIENLTKPPLKTKITINPINSNIGSITKITANVVDENNNNVTDGRLILNITILFFQ